MVASGKQLRTIAAFSQSMGVVIFVAVLYVARDILVPLALGGLFAFLLAPLVNRLQRLGLPNVYAVILTAAGLFCALFSLLYRDDIRDRFTSLVSRGNYVVTSDAIREASQRISQYLIVQTILNVTYGFVFTLGLLAIGYFLAPTGTFP